MKVIVEEVGPCRKKLGVEIPSEKVAQEYEQVLAMFASGAKVPGFRAGKVPKDIIKRRFDKEIAEEVKERLISTGYHEALKQEKINVISVLDVLNVKFEMGQTMSFQVLLDVPPKFELPDYQKISLKSKKVEVADKEVVDTIQRIREQNARYDEVTGRAVQKGDLVQVDYEGVCEGTPLTALAPAAAELGQAKDFWLMADEDSFLPGFGMGLVGGAIGEKRQLPVDFPADFREKAVAGKKATYFVSIKAIREKKLPEMNEEFLKGIGVESEAQLKEKIKEDLLRMGEEMEKRRLKGEIIKHLQDNTKMDIPESVAQQETQELIYDIVRENKYRGMGDEEIKEKKTEIFETATKNAVDRVKMRYILDAIAEKESIAATEEELSARIQEMAARYRETPAAFRAELEKRKALGHVRQEIRLSKTVDFLLEKAEIKQ